jgi:chromosomal replication initiator protein
MQAWKKFVEAQEQEFGPETVDKWLRSLKLVHFDACNLYLEAKDNFQALWFEEHMRAKVLHQLHNNNQKKIKVHLSVANAPAKKTRSNPKNSSPVSDKRFELIFDSLDTQCTFGRFVLAEANQLPFNIISEVCSRPKNSADAGALQFNPIYLHGNAGCGKTHLLMAATAALRQQGYHAVYCHTQTFTEHVVSAIRAGEMSVFRQAYRNSDVLLIDDVHVLSRRGATQEEFFHTFNALHLGEKQIILSANSPPGELQQIEPRLVSRFEWGIVLPLESATKAECAQIIQLKTALFEFTLHPKVTDFLLEAFSSALSINKAIDALVLRAHLNRQPRDRSGKPLNINVETAKQLLADLLQEEQRSALTSERIIRDVSEHFGIRPEDLLGQSQTRDCVLPRKIAMFFCRTELKMPFIKIGTLFSKDHSTVMSSVKLIQKALDAEDKEIANAHYTILKKLKSSREVLLEAQGVRENAGDGA